MHFSNFASDYLDNYVDWSATTLQIVSFAITFIIIVIAIGLAGKALTKLANFAALGLLNKLLGALFGAIKMGFILSIVLMLISKVSLELPFLAPKELKRSTLYVPVKSIVPTIFPAFLSETD